jgi:signal transduction histidine kinase
MSDTVPTPRGKLAEVLGGPLPDRVLGAESGLLFVLDADDAFVYADRDLAPVFDADVHASSGARFRPEAFVPSDVVARAVAAAHAGRATAPFPVVARDPGRRTQVWLLEALPVAAPSRPAGRCVACLLRPAAEPTDHEADAPLDSAALSERLERERLETTQAVAVTMRHEINNALTSLIGNAELILRRAEEVDAHTLARVREIAHQGRRIQTVLDRLEALTEIRTTTYYGGVQMIELGAEDGAAPDGEGTPGGE